MTAPEVYHQSDRSLTTIWLNRPSRKNAINRQGWIDIRSQLGLAEADRQCRVIVLRGVGGDFGAGADIAEFADVFHTSDQTLAYFADMEAAMQAIECAEKPVIAAIDGLCIGACVALALACDIRVASEQSRFAITPARLGIVYHYGDVRRVVAALAAGRTKMLMFSGRTIGAHEAEAIGLVDRVTADGDFSVELDELVQSIVENSLWTVRATKLAVRAVMGGQHAHTAGYPEMLATSVAGPDFIEGTKAFREKRSPRFMFEIPAAE